MKDAPQPSIENQLTVIVGAGASKEFRLPTGAELTSTIASLLDIRFDDFGRQISGDNLICDALRLIAQERFGNRNVNPFLSSLWRVRDAMPQTLSIDNYIDHHRGNKDIELCGKLAIARAILQAENRSSLYFRSGETLNFSNSKESWLNYLLQRATQCIEDELEDRLQNLKFIVFNYDRCIEQYVYHWLMNYYGCSPEKTSKIIEALEIYHPYGTIGALPQPFATPNTVVFGGEPTAVELCAIAKRIRTFTESTGTSSTDVVRIRSLVQTSRRVLFLGFAYHPRNLELLGMPYKRARAPRSFLGTAVGISASNVDIIKGSLFSSEMMDGSHYMSATGGAERIEIRHELDCKKLILDYDRALFP